VESGDRALVIAVEPTTGSSPRLLVALVDGAGHGPPAAVAADTAERYLREHPAEEIGHALGGLHAVLRGTRGAVAAMAHLDLGAGTLAYGGVGNVEGRLLRKDGGGARLISYRGLLGATLPRVRTFLHPLAAGDLLVLHSDGVSAFWTPTSYPGLHAEPPGVVASIVLRDWGRQTDDATVLALRCDGAD
jgi:hypothetical protein